MHSLINNSCETHFHLLRMVFNGVIDGEQGWEPPPWQTKCKNWASFS